MTFCDFKIRNMGDNIHQHSVQCALPINLFNEKFFILLWFWLMILAVFTLLSFLNWLKLLFRTFRRKAIARYLRSHNKLGNSEKERQLFGSFVQDYCYLDGAFIFAILRRNSNYITTSEIISSLWARYCRDCVRNNDLPKSILVSNQNDMQEIKIGLVDYNNAVGENKYEK